MKATTQRTPFCCGLYEVGNFGSSYGQVNEASILRSGVAYICVTRWSDIKQKAELKKWGFKKVGKWLNPNTGKKLTLWVFFPDENKSKAARSSLW